MTIPCRVPPRVHYFPGQVLSAEDFIAEQSYFREKLRQHNRTLHHPGIIEGLAVTLDATQVQVSPGLALDAAGNELCVPATQTALLPKTPADVFVVLRYDESAIDPVPVPGPPGSDSGTPSRIQETFTLGYEPVGGVRPPPSTEDSTPPVRLAHLLYTQGTWRLDPTFHHAEAR